MVGEKQLVNNITHLETRPDGEETEDTEINPASGEEIESRPPIPPQQAEEKCPMCFATPCVTSSISGSFGGRLSLIFAR